ncbi:ABC transporter substrate-binding protein [Psychrobacillus sp. NPDC096389]|uniref:ABC transporter substrate-binding protein n=1 Tax=Psychrobacillus sp. NPDC096389 TaxID=3364490 RepID=UPI0038128965
MQSTRNEMEVKSLVAMIPLLLLIALILSACESTNNSTEKMNDSVVKEESTTKKVMTGNGEIEIPTHPKRIVAEEYLGSLIALDVIPVGAPGLSIQNYYYKDKLEGIEDIGDYGNPSTEKILALNPDIIISGNSENYETLSKIAPTIVIPYGELSNVHDELTYFGDLLGQEEAARVWLEQYDQRIAEAKSQVDAAIEDNLSFSILEDGGKSTWVYGDNFGRGGQPIYQALGRKPPAGVAEEIMEKQWAEISEEMLAEYAGDFIIMTSDDRTVEDFKADPIWGSLSAVKNDRLYVWPEERSWYYDPLAVLIQTEELTTWLTSLEK